MGERQVDFLPPTDHLRRTGLGQETNLEAHDVARIMRRNWPPQLKFTRDGREPPHFGHKASGESVPVMDTMDLRQTRRNVN